MPTEQIMLSYKNLQTSGHLMVPCSKQVQSKSNLFPMQKLPCSQNSAVCMRFFGITGGAHQNPHTSTGHP